MAKPKKTSNKSKPSVKVQDLKPTNDPKGGRLPVGQHLTKVSLSYSTIEIAPIKK